MNNNAGAVQNGIIEYAVNGGGVAVILGMDNIRYPFKFNQVYGYAGEMAEEFLTIGMPVKFTVDTTCGEGSIKKVWLGLSFLNSCNRFPLRADKP